LEREKNNGNQCCTGGAWDTQNTGNIARTCAAVGLIFIWSSLWVFSWGQILKACRSGLLDKVNIKYYDSFSELRDKYKEHIFYYSTTKAQKLYTDVKYPDDCLLFLAKKRRVCRKNCLWKQGMVHQDSDERWYPLFKSFKLCCHNCIWSITTEQFCRTCALWKTD